MPEQPLVTLYADGACLGNPGAGGYGLILARGRQRKEMSGGFRLTTNNRMELMAAVVGLAALNTPCKVRLVSDSKYLVDTMQTGLAAQWKAKGWKRGKSGKVENVDLWERLLDLCAIHAVTFEWVAGHSGHPENERCDYLSYTAARRRDLPPDLPYENGTTRQSQAALF
jgi:ribonuclease HI